MVRSCTAEPSRRAILGGPDPNLGRGLLCTRHIRARGLAGNRFMVLAGFFRVTIRLCFCCPRLYLVMSRRRCGG